MCCLTALRCCSQRMPTAVSIGCRPTGELPSLRKPTRAKPRGCLEPAASVVAATGTMGKLYRLSESETADGSYESPVHDAGTVARWGQLAWRGDRHGSAKLAFRTRDGEFGEAGPYLERLVGTRCAIPVGSSVTSPNARFIQWRAEFSGATASSPVVSGVTLGIPAAE